MTIEKSHGKARPTLPRASDLGVVDTAEKPSAGRDVGGRFSAGNRLAEGARWKASIKRSLGPRSAGDADLVFRDAWRVYLATLRALPSDAAPVRSLAALHARHMALNGYFTAAASEAGLTSDRGTELQALADAQSQRAERTLVSCIAIAKALAGPRAKTSSLASMRARVAAAVEVAKEEPNG